jgi:hypothetical protein
MSEDVDTEDGPSSKGIAYLLWMGWLFGFAGLHRFYLGRPGTGLLYLLTWGLFGVGQIIDLIQLPRLVAKENTKHAALQALAEKRALRAMHHRALLPSRSQVTAERPEDFRKNLLMAAAEHGGRLSVTQGVMATGKSFKEVESELDQMVQSGYVGIDNDEKTGIVVYTFGQLE